MSVRTRLFGSPLRAAATALLAVGFVVVGAVAVGLVGVPSVETVDNRFGAVNETETTVETDLVVHNPNPVGVRLGDLDVEYAVSMNDVEMASGVKDGVAVGTGNSTLHLATNIHNDRIPDWWTSHVARGEQTNVTVTATARSGVLGRSVTVRPATRTVETDLLGQFNSSEDRPVNASAPLVDDPVLVVEQTNASWGSVTDSGTPIELTFDVYNPKATPVAVSNVGYTVTMNDVQVGQGRLRETESIPGHATRTVETPTVIDHERLDEWWVTHLRNDQTTTLRVDFHAYVDLPGSNEPVRVPLRGLTYEHTVETDIFGTKAENASAGNASSGAGSTSGNESATSGTTAGGDGVAATGTTDGETATAGTPTTDGTGTDGGTATSGTTTDDGLFARGEPSRARTDF